MVLRTKLFVFGMTAAAAAIVSCNFLLGGSDKVKFSHAKHGETGIGCADCHEKIDASESAEERHIPKEAKCLECHEDWKKEGKCDTCHTVPDKPLPYAGAEIRLHFSHKSHMGPVEGKCEECHPAAAKSEKIGGKMPGHDQCMDCHDKDYAIGDCGGCHSDLRKYPLEPVSSFNHEGDFLREHGLLAKSKEDVCSQCHDYSFCSDCHAKTAKLRPDVKYPEKVERDFIHRADYKSRHAIEARSDPAMCQKCHGKSFCLDCHEKEGRAPSSLSPESPHPAGWNTSHGKQARVKIESCAACHDKGAATNCVKCHAKKSGMYKVHPADWNRREKAAEMKNNATCKVCHDRQ